MERPTTLTTVQFQRLYHQPPRHQHYKNTKQTMHSMSTRPKTNDLFITTLHELHSEAPAELLSSLRAQLKQIRSTNPNCAQTAEACLEALASDQSSLLHVLTAAYLINGGVMIKHQAGAIGNTELGSLDSSDPLDPLDSLGPLDPLDPLDSLDSLDSLYPSSEPQNLERLESSLDLNEFNSLEEELNRFSISMDGSLKPKPSLQSQQSSQSSQSLQSSHTSHPAPPSSQAASQTPAPAQSPAA